MYSSSSIKKTSYTIYNGNIKYENFIFVLKQQ